MNRAEFNTFCATLPATSHVVQWGNADVWKVGPKVFAMCGWNEGRDAFTFRVTDMAFEILPGEHGIRPAPYLASRGMKWVQVYEPPNATKTGLDKTGLDKTGPDKTGLDNFGMSDTDLKAHIRASYAIISKGISRKKRAELGIPEPDL